MHFDEQYFRPELRMGFYITERMKRTWAANLENLVVLDSVCHRLGIRYFMDYGTLLGATRHKGFIPWDDDVDVAMLREDYMRFLTEAPALLSDGMYISSYYTNEKHLSPQATLLNRKDIGEDARITEKFHGCPFITGVDIFPLDFVPDDIETRKEMMLYYSVFYDGGHRFLELQENGELDGIIQRVENLLGFTFDHSGNLQRQFYLEADRIAMEMASENSSAIAWMPEVVSKGWEKTLEKSWYMETQKLQFEGMQFDAPIQYDAVLMQYYGEGYMSDYVRGGADHTYPFYQEQMDFVRQNKPALASRIFSYAKNGEWGRVDITDPEKRNIQNIIDELSKAMRYFQTHSLNYEERFRLLGDGQQIAMEIGGFIEARLENSLPLIFLLEVYCEALYQCGEGECEADEILRILKDFGEAFDELPVY